VEGGGAGAEGGRALAVAREDRSARGNWAGGSAARAAALREKLVGVAALFFFDGAAAASRS